MLAEDLKKKVKLMNNQDSVNVMIVHLTVLLIKNVKMPIKLVKKQKVQMLLIVQCVEITLLFQTQQEENV